MSGKREKSFTSSFADDKVSEDDKNIDSGFISGGNLTISEEIQPEDSTPQAPVQEEYMRLDSGVDLSESLSGLSLKNSAHFNDLSCSKTKQDHQPPVETSTCSEDEWKQFFQQDEDGNTFLHYAIAENFKVLEVIKKAPHQMFLDTQNDDAVAPIHLATCLRQPKIVRWLIVAGAKPSPRNINGDSPLHIAAKNGDLDCCKAITDPIQEQERRELVLSYTPPLYNINLDQWNYAGQTCVHVAAIEGHAEVLRHLVWNGADVNSREGCGGFTALHLAIQRQHEKVASYLLFECKELNAQAVTYGGESVLQLGYAIPPYIADILRQRNVSSPYSSDESDSESSESELYENAMFVQSNLVNASA